MKKQSKEKAKKFFAIAVTIILLLGTILPIAITIIAFIENG